MRKIKLNEHTYIPILGLGTYLNTERDVLINTLLEAFKIGYRHIDTAMAYYNEELIAEAIKLSNLQREEIFLTTKIKIHPNQEMVVKQIEERLVKLNTNYLDLVLIHWPSQDYELNYQTYQVLEKYHNKGIIKSIGVSNFNEHHLDSLLKKCQVKPAINQVEMHPGMNQLKLQKYLKSKEIQMQSYGPFKKGQIFQSPIKEVLEPLAKKYQTNIASVVIAWGLNREIIMIPMSTNPVNLLNNYQAKNIVLDQEDIELINNIGDSQRVYSDPDTNTNYLFEE